MTLVKGQSDFKVKCLTVGLYTQVSDSGPLGPLVLTFLQALFRLLMFRLIVELIQGGPEGLILMCRLGMHSLAIVIIVVLILFACVLMSLSLI